MHKLCISLDYFGTGVSKDKTLVILARVYQGDKTLVIAWEFQKA